MSSGTPLVVLLHGPFCDATIWDRVARRLEAAGIATHAVTNPLRGLCTDVAHIRSMVRRSGRPVVLVGHSYGAAVATHVAASGVTGELAGSNMQGLGPHGGVVGLVSVAGCALDMGESLADTMRPGVLRRARPEQGRPPARSGGRSGNHSSGRTLLYLSSDSFVQLFAPDLCFRQARMMALRQRPMWRRAYAERAQESPVVDVPGWSVVTEDDKLIPVEHQLRSAARIGTLVTTVKATHAVPVSQPDVVAGAIIEAVHTSSRAMEIA